MFLNTYSLAWSPAVRHCANLVTIYVTSFLNLGENGQASMSERYAFFMPKV
uniref:Uncharacterized protein n=1 Tax=Kalanchoe fedtschenkoi TaxID=63787 RepID=A0A7N0VCG5_KALFE